MKASHAESANLYSFEKNSSDMDTIEYPLTSEMEFIKAMEKHRILRREKFQNERKQELIEREFSQKLTSLEELEVAMEFQDSGVKGQMVEFLGKKIPVIKMVGKPFRFLQHTVDFRLSPDTPKESTGYLRSSRLLDDPSFWLRQEMDEFGGKSNTLSCSYIDTEINILHGGAVSYRGITYGFNSMDPDTVIGAFNGDGETLNNIGETPGREGCFEEYDLDRLAKNSTSSYNEILLRRYDGNGKTILPNFLVTYDDYFSEEMMRHASFFGVPIIDVVREPYLEKQEKEILKELERIDENSTYSEVLDFFQFLSETSLEMNAIKFLKKNKNEVMNDEFDSNFFLRRFNKGTVNKIKKIINEIEPRERLKMLEERILSQSKVTDLRKKYRNLISDIQLIVDSETGKPEIRIVYEKSISENQQIKLETIIKEEDDEFAFWQSYLR